MLAFARETRLSETTFVQSAERDGADYRNRIFTVREELPFAGHPSLGTAVAVALARGEREVTLRAGDGGRAAADRRAPRRTGRVRLDAAGAGGLRRRSGRAARAGRRRARARRRAPGASAAGGLDRTAHAGRAGGRRSHCVANAQPDFDLLDVLAERCGASNFYLVCLRDDGKAHAHACSRAPSRAGRTLRPGPPPGRCAPTSRSAGAGRRSRSPRAWRWAVPSRLLAEMEGDRARVERRRGARSSRERVSL